MRSYNMHGHNGRNGNYSLKLNWLILLKLPVAVGEKRPDREAVKRPLWFVSNVIIFVNLPRLGVVYAGLLAVLNVLILALTLGGPKVGPTHKSKDA